MKLDLENDIAVMHGKRVKLSCTSSGHYCILLRDEKEVCKETEEIMLTIGNDEKTKKEHRKTAPTIWSSHKWEVNSVIERWFIDDEMCFVHAEKVSNICDMCVKYKKTPSRPVVSVTMAKSSSKCSNRSEGAKEG